MYSVTNISWNSVGGAIINPYNPTQDGSGYKHLFATTTASYNKVYEQGETQTYSDNFFYKKIEIAVPNIADLQVPAVTAQVLPNLEPGVTTNVTTGGMHGSLGAILDENNNKIYGWEECYVPSPLSAAGLRSSTDWYSGKKVAVTVTVANKGGVETKSRFNTVLYMSSSPDHDATPRTTIASKTCTKSLQPGDSITLTYAFNLPYDWHGDTYFHAYADINDAVYELANTQNNWGTSDKYDVSLCPGADFEPSNLSVPKSMNSDDAFTVSYKVTNKGAGIPFVNNWKDQIYISKKNTGLDETAVLLASANRTGGFKKTQNVGTIKPEEYTYEGDNYTNNVEIKPTKLTDGTYYIYVKADAADDVYEGNGEGNNVVCSDTVTLKHVTVDLAVELVSVSADTLTTGCEVAFCWKLKNIGSADIKDVKITDAIYATVNQTASSGVEIARVENSVWIAAGQEKIVRANITIPDNSKLDGLRYIYMKTNVTGSLTELTTRNNTSGVMKSWWKYTTEPVVKTVRGANLNISNLQVKGSMKPGEEVTLTYVAQNNGDSDLDATEIADEVFLSNNATFNINNATKCEIAKHIGTVAGLTTTQKTSISLTFKVPDIYGGKNYLHLFVDRANVLGEKNTADNYARAQIQIAGNLPDLEVTAYELSDTLMTSQDYVLNFTVGNTGEWDAAMSQTRIYLSSDNKYDSGDLLLASVQTDALAEEASVAQRATINIADKYAGNRYLLIWPNANGKIVELNENNVKSVPVTVVQSPLPDVTVVSLATDSVLTSGKPVKVQTKIRNIGKNATRISRWSDTYYLSNSTVLNTGTAVKLGSTTHVGTLEVGADYSREASFTIPVSVQGNYMLFVVTDAADAVVEENESNNTKGIPVFINGSADTPADLLVTNVTAPGTIKAGEDVTVSYQIKNAGEYPAAANLRDVIYLSKDNRWDLDDVMVGVVSGNVTIEPGNSVTRNVTGRIINVPEGDYYVIVKTNSTHSVAETNTDNNAGVMSSAVKLSFNTISLDNTASFTTSAYYKLNIPGGSEGKTVGFYLDCPADAAAGLYAAYGQVPTTAKYDFASSALDETKLEVLIPNVEAGDYYVLAQDNAALVNSTGNVFRLSGGSQQTVFTPMSLTARDINFGATTLSISEGGTGGWISTDVNGALFDSIMDFRLKLDETVIPAEAITFNSMTRSRVTFNLNDAQTGTYDVVSELPDGTQATLPQGFKVIPGASVSLGARIDAPSSVHPETYVPVSISYANGGNTDCRIYDLVLSIDNGGYLATTIKGIKEHRTSLSLPVDAESDARGYKTIPPGTQKTINVFLYPSSTSNLYIYVVE
jgi:subtilase family serine protease